MALVIFEDEHGVKLASYATQLFQYLFADGSQMQVPSRAAWCLDCERFVLAESLRPAEEMRASTLLYHDRHGDLMPGVDSVQEKSNVDALLRYHLPTLEQWTTALSRRQSLPRCLECGGTSAVALPDIEGWFSHPRIPNQPVRTKWYLADIGGKAHFYDIEGQRLHNSNAFAAHERRRGIRAWIKAAWTGRRHRTT